MILKQPYKSKSFEGFIQNIPAGTDGQTLLKAIRENEPRATSLGYNVNDYKWAAFVISAALSGLAGSKI